MPIQITCPQCDKKLNAPDSAVGKKIRCPACKAVIDVPAEEPLEEPEKFEEPEEESAITEEAPPPKKKSRPSDEFTEDEPKGYGLDEDDADERDRRREKRRKRYDDDEDDDFDEDYGDMRPRRRMEPHRGGVILTLGILSIPLLFCPLICWILAAIAVNMANADLPKMARGHMDPSGQGSTSAGKVCAYIGTILGLFWCVAGAAIRATGKF